MTYPSPSVITILAAPFLSDRISLVAEGHLITAVELTSESGSLRPLDLVENSPFDIVEVLTDNRVVLRSSSGVMVRNEQLPVAWDSNGEADIRAVFESEGARVIVPRIVFTSNEVIPEPNASLLLMAMLPALGLLRRKRRVPCQNP